MKFFLRLKHWQLFVLHFGIPVVFYCILMANIFATLISSGGQPNPFFMFRFMAFIPIILLFSAGTILCWQWAVVNYMKHLLPAGITLKFNLFRVFFFIPLVYFCLLAVFMLLMLNSGITQGAAPSPAFLGVFFLIVPLHLFSIFCLFYNIYFSAKVLKTIELQRSVTFSDFVGEFFLIWFFFVGIWILQPRINKLIDPSLAKPSSDPFGV